MFWSKYFDSVLVSAFVVFGQSALIMSLRSSALIVFGQSTLIVFWLVPL